VAEKPHPHALDEQLLRFDCGRGVPCAGKEVHRGPEGGLADGTRVQIPNLPGCVTARPDHADARLLPFRVQPRPRCQEVRLCEDGQDGLVGGALPNAPGVEARL